MTEREATETGGPFIGKLIFSNEAERSNDRNIPLSPICKHSSVDPSFLRLPVWHTILMKTAETRRSETPTSRNQSPLLTGEAPRGSWLLIETFPQHRKECQIRGYVFNSLISCWVSFTKKNPRERSPTEENRASAESAQVGRDAAVSDTPGQTPSTAKSGLTKPKTHRPPASLRVRVSPERCQ